LLATARTSDDLYNSPILSWIPRHLYEPQKTTSGERELQALLSISSSGSYLAREAETDCRKIIGSDTSIPVLVFVDRRDELFDIEPSDMSRWPERDDFVIYADDSHIPGIDAEEDRDDSDPCRAIDYRDVATDRPEDFDTLRKAEAASFGEEGRD
jgi:hypothetical protein